MENAQAHVLYHRFTYLIVISLFLHIPWNKKHQIVFYWINWDIKEQIHPDPISPPWAPGTAVSCQRNKKAD